jgi:hypothetical protein
MLRWVAFIVGIISAIVGVVAGFRGDFAVSVICVFVFILSFFVASRSTL